MAMTTPTDYWNDSSSVEELTYAIEHGAVGATSNPTIVVSVLKKEMHLWRDRIRQIIAEIQLVRSRDDEESGDQRQRRVAVPPSCCEGPRRLSIQTNPADHRNAAIVEQACCQHPRAEYAGQSW
jgi:transaldolase